mmetsp:Transcript_58513/g.110139  ORF Transcript_58513/g.110139 Transcript_58513/m.110139 type:complete len:139 (+) Transcript_58513:1268-1684(+)
MRGPLREEPREPPVEPLVGALTGLPKGPPMPPREPVRGPGGIMVTAPVSGVAEGDVNASDAGRVLISKERLSESSGRALRGLPKGMVGPAFERMPGLEAPNAVGKDLALGGKAFVATAVDFPHDSEGIEALELAIGRP